MNNTLVDVSGKLPSGLVQLYRDINQQARSLGIDILVVGAMARDLVLVHGYGASIERGTRDVDFGVQVQGWGEFNQLRDALLASGYHTDDNHPHSFRFPADDGLPWPVDIVPFGDIANDGKISWPPGHDFVMNVLGFSEALASALKVKIDESGTVIPVASPAGICLLKMVAWLDREIGKRAKDATDIKYLMDTYSKIPEVFDALYEEDYMESQDWDEPAACAMKLGNDTGSITTPAVANYLQEELFSNETRKERLLVEMKETRTLHVDADLRNRLEVFINAFCGSVDRG